MATLAARADAVTGTRAQVVELVTRIPRGRVTREVSTDLTDYCLSALNRFLGVYVVATEQSDVHDVTFEHLSPETTLGLRHTVHGKNKRLVMPDLHAPLPGEAQPSREGFLPLLADLLRSEPNRHPIDLVRKLKVRADRFADQGDFEAAVITLQSSAERLVFALHGLIGVDQNWNRAAIDAAEPATFKRALTSFGNTLGGNWGVKGSHPVAVYWSDLYTLRNRIVHAGISVDRVATADAFAAYEALNGYCLERCLAARRRYPRTALALHGVAGLEQAGALDERMRQFVGRIRAERTDHTFWLPHDER